MFGQPASNFYIQYLSLISSVSDALKLISALSNSLLKQKPTLLALIEEQNHVFRLDEIKITSSLYLRDQTK